MRARARARAKVQQPANRRANSAAASKSAGNLGSSKQQRQPASRAKSPAKEIVEGRGRERRSLVSANARARKAGKAAAAHLCRHGGGRFHCRPSPRAFFNIAPRVPLPGATVHHSQDCHRCQETLLHIYMHSANRRSPAALHAAPSSPTAPLSPHDHRHHDAWPTTPIVTNIQ